MASPALRVSLAPNKAKRTTLTLEQKKSIYEFLDKGCKRHEIAVKFDCAVNTISSLNNKVKRQQIMDALNSNHRKECICEATKDSRRKIY
jgi:DNA-binding NarL/FixJ family response regulator